MRRRGGIAGPVITVGGRAVVVCVTALVAGIVTALIVAAPVVIVSATLVRGGSAEGRS